MKLASQYNRRLATKCWIRTYLSHRAGNLAMGSAFLTADL